MNLIELTLSVVDGPPNGKKTQRFATYTQNVYCLAEALAHDGTRLFLTSGMVFDVNESYETVVEKLESAERGFP